MRKSSNTLCKSGADARAAVSGRSGCRDIGGGAHIFRDSVAWAAVESVGGACEPASGRAAIDLGLQCQWSYYVAVFSRPQSSPRAGAGRPRGEVETGAADACFGKAEKLLSRALPGARAFRRRLIRPDPRRQRRCVSLYTSAVGRRGGSALCADARPATGLAVARRNLGGSCRAWAARRLSISSGRRSA